MIIYYITPHIVNDISACELLHALNREYVFNREHGLFLKNQNSAYDEGIVSRVINGLFDLIGFGEYSNDYEDKERVAALEMIYASRGTVMHRIFKRFFADNYKSPKTFLGRESRAFTNYLHQRADSGYDVIIPWLGLISKCEERLKKTAETFADENWEKRDIYRGKNVALERTWVFSIDGWKYPIVLRGKLDMFRVTDKYLIVRDYKSTYREEDFDPEKSFQFPSYSFLVEKGEMRLKKGEERWLHYHKERPVIEVYVAGYDKEHETQRISFQFTKEINEFVRAKTIETAERMRRIKIDVSNDRKIEPTYGDHCNNCVHAWGGACDLYTGAHMFEDKKGVHLLDIMPKKDEPKEVRTRKRRHKKLEPEEQMHLRLRQRHSPSVSQS
jgi:hypothetical protein